jgi:hypothetical protein
VRGSAPGLLLPRIPHLDGRDHQGALALEVLVEGRLGDARLFDHPIQAHSVETVAIEELDRGGHEPAPAPGGNLENAEELGG